MSESAGEDPGGRREPAGGPAADGVWEGPDRLRWLEDLDGIDLPAVDALVEGLAQVQMAKTVQHALSVGDDARTDGEAAKADVDDGGTWDAAAGAAGAADVAGAAAETGDARTLDQIRTDVFADVLLTAVPDGHGPADVFEKIAAHVQVLIPARTLNPAVDADAAHTCGTATRSPQYKP